MKEKKKLPDGREREDRKMRILKTIELVAWSVCLLVHIFNIIMIIYFAKQLM